MKLLPGAEPFRLNAEGPRRALLLHGFASTPFEMRYLGERLQRAGWTSVCPLLPGHGTELDFFERTTWRDWYETARSSFERLSSEARGAPVAVIGQSLGALLALKLAARRGDDVAALACLATPLEFSPLSQVALTAYRFSPLRFFGLRISRSGGADINETRLRRGLPGYDKIPLKAAASFRSLQSRVDDLLGAVRSPLLVLHGEDDHTAPASNAERLMREVGSATKQLQLLPGSYHVLSLDVDKAEVALRLVEFLDRYAPRRGAEE